MKACSIIITQSFSGPQLTIGHQFNASHYFTTVGHIINEIHNCFRLYLSAIIRFRASGENYSFFMCWDKRIFLLVYSHLSCRYIMIIAIFYLYCPCCLYYYTMASCQSV